MKGRGFKALLVAVMGVATMTCALFFLQENKNAKARLLLGNPAAVVKDSPSSEVPGMDKHEGWKPIFVFYGDKRHLKDTVPHKSIWQAQAGQDQIVYRLFSRRGKTEGGYFIDLAANDAVGISNTYALEYMGWNGLCLEPNPAYWHRLSYRKCDVIAALVGSTTMEEVDVSFPKNGPFGGIVGNGFDNKPGNGEVTEKRYTVSLVDVLKMFHVPQVIDYLSLDVEGAEEFIMMNFPFDEWKISLLTVERPSPTLQNLLRSNGYMFLKKLTKWGETLWAHETMGFTPQDVQDVTATTIYVDEKNFVAGDLIID